MATGLLLTGHPDDVARAGRAGLPHATVASFGPFRLFMTERLLERDGIPVPLGSRAMDILIALASRAGETVTTGELIALVWPDQTIEEGALRVHLAALRKALGPGPDGPGYVVNLPGRGYQLVARDVSGAGHGQAARLAPSHSDYGLPAKLAGIAGRETFINNIVSQIRSHQLITIIGPGGIGKTTVAVVIAHEVQQSFSDGVYFFDLGTLREPDLVASSICALLKYQFSGDNLQNLADLLANKDILLVLDNCEHLIDTVATVVGKLTATGDRIHILATSREPLAIEGERIHRLPPLTFPHHIDGLRAVHATRFSAVQLLVDRIAKNFDGFELLDRDVAAAVNICRKVDGIALAIELAAAHVGVFGLREVESLLDGQISLIWRGRRTAPPRQQTLTATLEWSFGLLDQTERDVMLRLSVLVGPFDLETAQAIAADGKLHPEEVAVVIDSLIAKSLIASEVDRDIARYRLLYITREYALAKLIESGDFDACSRRHALHFLQLLGGESTGVVELSRPPANPALMEQIGNIRAALEWAFSPRGDPTVGISMATASTSLFLAMSIGEECERWNEIGLKHLDASSRGSRPEMLLQAARAIASRWSDRDTFRIASRRSLEIAEQLGSRQEQLQLLHYFQVTEIGKGHTGRALELAQTARSLLATEGDRVALAIADSTLGVIYHVIGDVEKTRAHCQAALDARLTFTEHQLAGVDEHIFRQARFALAKNLWFRGYPLQAMDAAREVIKDSRSASHYCWQNAVIWTNHIFQWCGEWATVLELLAGMKDHADERSESVVERFVLAIEGDCMVHCGDPAQAVTFLDEQLAKATAINVRTQMMIALASGLLALGRNHEALGTVDRALAGEREFGDSYWTPEVLRLRGEIQASLPEIPEATAMETLRRAVAMAQSQQCLGWELRATTAMARLLQRQKRFCEAERLLAPVYARFTEGFDTADLVAARTLLTELAQFGTGAP